VSPTARPTTTENHNRDYVTRLSPPAQGDTYRSEGSKRMTEASISKPTRWAGRGVATAAPAFAKKGLEPSRRVHDRRPSSHRLTPMSWYRGDNGRDVVDDEYLCCVRFGSLIFRAAGEVFEFPVTLWR